MNGAYYKDTVRDALFPKKKGVIARNNRFIKVTEPGKMTKEEIRKLRLSLSLSISLFAAVFNVSSKTVEAWESGVNEPSGTSLRLMRMMEKNPDILFETGVLQDLTALR